MSDRVKSVHAHLRSSVTQDLEDLRKAYNLYDAAKQDLLQKEDSLRKSVRLYENFLGVYNFEPSDLNLSLPRKSESVQTDSLPSTVTSTNSETQTDCIGNTQESSVATQTMCGVRDVGISVMPVVECATHQPYTQGVKAYVDVAGENSTYRGSTSNSYPLASTQRAAEVTDDTRGSLLHTAQIQLNTAADDASNGMFIPETSVTANVLHSSSMGVAQVTSVTHGGLLHSIHAPQDESPAPHRERADNISTPTEAGTGHATICDSATAQTFVGKTPQPGYALSQQRATPPIKIISDIQLPTGQQFIRGSASNMNSLQRIELVTVDPESVTGKSVSSIPDLLLQEQAIATIDPLEVSINGEPNQQAQAISPEAKCSDHKAISF
ncbi:hypothetical protein QAD02_002800 [Eretmocerus hayati]|uniref:Uncharacterized protein n=1 Tax=Eretmocerus hayati TaxID=131215 RepID=A0ACC2NKC0_9HYME|nr:hypothetical protein QAD02_002800 [Eretmocerus hayati]